jgi:hypothetical protein
VAAPAEAPAAAPAEAPAAAPPEAPEGAIPDRPEEDSQAPGRKHRLYERLAALDFQKNTDGHWVYFPWGVWGRGYLVQKPGMQEEMEQFLARFSCVHSSLAAILGVTAFSIWFYHPQASYAGPVLLGFYLLLAYAFLWIRTSQWTSTLPPSVNRMNSNQYFFIFFKILKGRALLELEAISLYLTLACAWLLVSEEWKWLIDPGSLVFLWLFTALSGLMLVWFSFLNYFRRS